MDIMCCVQLQACVSGWSDTHQHTQAHTKAGRHSSELYIKSKKRKRNVYKKKMQVQGKHTSYEQRIKQFENGHTHTDHTRTPTHTLTYTGTTRRRDELRLVQLGSIFKALENGGEKRRLVRGSLCPAAAVFVCVSVYVYLCESAPFTFLHTDRTNAFLCRFPFYLGLFS